MSKVYISKLSANMLKYEARLTHSDVAPAISTVGGITVLQAGVDLGSVDAFLENCKKDLLWVPKEEENVHEIDLATLRRYPSASARKRYELSLICRSNHSWPTRSVTRFGVCEFGETRVLDNQGRGVGSHPKLNEQHLKLATCLFASDSIYERINQVLATRQEICSKLRGDTTNTATKNALRRRLKEAVLK